MTDAHPARLCLEAPQMAEAGRRRAVLVVYALSGGELAVTADDGAATRFRVFPGGAFDSADGSDPQRFFLPGGATVTCWEVELAQGQNARLGLELSAPLD